MASPDMARTQSPAMVSGATTPKSTETSGYLLLTIQHAVVKQVYDDETMVLAQGEMRLECISLPIPGEIGKQTANPFAPSDSDPAVPTHDFWLVLNVSTFQAPLIPTQAWTPLPKTLDGISYSVPSQTVPSASIVVTLPLPNITAELEDLDSLEVLLRQYGSLGAESTALADIEVPQMGTSAGCGGNDMLGRLVLINEDSGEVVGELDRRLDVVEDKIIAKGSKDKPVMLDFEGVVDGYSPQVVVKTVPQEEMDDWMLKGAHIMSQGILGFGSWSSNKMQSGAELFIRNTKAAEKPVHFSPTTKAGIRMTHNASVKSVKVAKTTLGKINDALSVVAEKAYSTTVEPAVDFYQEGQKRLASSSGATRAMPPPLPPKPVGTALSGSAISSLPSSQPNGTAGSGQHVSQRQPSPLAGASPTDSVSGKPPVAPKPANSALNTDVTSKNGAATASPSSVAKKRPFFNRLLLAGEVVLTSLEATAQDLISNGTNAASSAAEHKFGPEAGYATALLGGSVRNAAVVYIDVRGVGRKALLTGTAKGIVKARLKSGETVQLQAGGVERPGGVEVEAGEVERGEKGTVLVGMPQVGTATAVGAGQGQSTVAGARDQQGGQGLQRGVTTVDKETLEMLDRMK